MKFGICTSVDHIRSVEKMGYDYLEPRASDIAAMPDREFEQTLELARSSSIPCDCFNVLLPQHMSLLGPEYNRAEMESYLHRAFSRLQRLGGKLVVFGSGRLRSRPEWMDTADAYRQLVLVTRRMGQIAGEYGLTLAIEPLNRNETNMIRTLAEGAMLMEDVSLKNVQLLADLYHMQCENDALGSISKVGRLAHAHIASKEGRRYPLSDEAPFREFFGQLFQIGFTGGVSVEGNTKDFEHDAPAALAVLRRLRDQCDPRQ